MLLLDFLPIIILISGAFLLFKLDFLFIKHPLRSIRAFKNSIRSKAAARALMLSLAGTLGVGNIVGVAFGLSVGGAGSVFWLLVSAVFSMAIKYSEASLAADMKAGGDGGMMYVIKKSFPKKLSYLSYVYAELCLLLSITMGSMLQAHSAVESIKTDSGYTLIWAVLIFTAAVVFAAFGGAEKIEGITSVVIPLAAVVYIVLTLLTILKNHERLPSVTASIFKEAFSLRAAAGGTGGFMIARAMREGFCRGLLSNEAGSGTSAMAHTRSDIHPAEAGVLGITEVFADTVLLCMLTALAVLCAVPNPEAFGSGLEIISSAFECLGNAAPPLLSFCIVSFAFSTVICWYYYGEVCMKFLFKKQHGVYRIAFILSVLIGGALNSSILIRISDYLLFFMSLLSLIAVIKNSDRVKSLSESYGIITKRGYGKEG